MTATRAAAAATAVALAITLALPVVQGRPQTTGATVVRWTDGDTVVLSLAGSAERTRLIGIDAPETSDGERARSQAKRTGLTVPEILALGEAARRFAESSAPPGTRVGIETDVQTRDRYGRLLAYLWLGNVLLNEEIVRAGWAAPLTIPPNVKYSDRIRRAFADAVNSGRSIWVRR